MLPNDVLKKWWIEKARLGMTPSEATLSIRDALKEAGYIIIQDHIDPEGGIPGRQL